MPKKHSDEQILLRRGPSPPFHQFENRLCPTSRGYGQVGSAKLAGNLDPQSHYAIWAIQELSFEPLEKSSAGSARPENVCEPLLLGRCEASVEPRQDILQVTFHQLGGLNGVALCNRLDQSRMSMAFAGRFALLPVKRDHEGRAGDEFANEIR
ncbi:hypothetical protein SM2011_a6371 (plasmid) [Sinorhizobium meliloti 2011]|nr:hypothetical protein SM2011_a6371 [Sinorhizobium meliloti 2011]